MHAKLAQLAAYLGSGDWFVGGSVTFVDFILYDLVDALKCLDPTVADKYPALVKFLARFEALPKIKAYMSSDKFIPMPIVAPWSPWGGSR